MDTTPRIPVEQMAFPFYCDEAALGRFLTSWLTLETEEERLREEKRVLKEQYQEDFPMRAVLAAIKIVRTREGLAAHPKEPLPREHLESLCDLVERHYHRLAEEIAAVAQEATQALGQSTGQGEN